METRDICEEELPEPRGDTLSNYLRATCSTTAPKGVEQIAAVNHTPHVVDRVEEILERTESFQTTVDRSTLIGQLSDERIQGGTPPSIAYR